MMGGLLIILSVTISTALWQDFRSNYTWIVLLALIAFGLIGFLDDFLKISRKSSKGLQAGLKFSGQIILSLSLVLYLHLAGSETCAYLYLPFIKAPVLDLQAVYIPFAVVLLVGSSNAVNLTDWLDVLATGLLILVGVTFALLPYLTLFQIAGGLCS